ncbi:sulfatase [Dyadobacter sp. CY356]|uniref:sulfatase family protein n=1 Tax=Dyadobacter sp. CY356 TaxID=2906442 RepID=UPI001F320847|nr:sulfatase [Dyadobacter sp. CY356]MCF0055427.1 sulfatase [Dyadobacter sp. CY356]
MKIRKFVREVFFFVLLVLTSMAGFGQRIEVRKIASPNLIFQLGNRQLWDALTSRTQSRQNKNARDNTKPKPSRPNIIFVLTDDHRWDALGVMGNNIIKTPNLDALAERGILFKKAYVTTSICCVSRASLLSGQYMSRHKINDFSTCFSKKALDKTYPALLKKAGYKIGFIGKFGIDSNRQPDSLFDYWACPKVEQPPYLVVNRSGQTIHNTDSVGKDIKQFLYQFAGQQEPFCLSVSFKAPHESENDPPTFPYQERFASLYQNTNIPKPVTTDPKYWNSFPEFFRSDKNIGRQRWKTFFSTEEKRQETVKNYYRLITGVDEAVGNMVAQLKQLQIDRNTIIIFMGDNGFSLGEHGLEGKWFGFEESIRVPLIISGAPIPRKLVGKKTNNIALNIDIASTILSFAGVATPATIQGKDLMASFKNGATEREDFFYEHTFIGSPGLPKVEGVVSKKFKYMKYIEHNYEEFYNTKRDPRETNNLIEQKSTGNNLAKFRKRYAVLKKAAK